MTTILPEKELALVGRGKLTWMKSERISDRYGAVWLMSKDNNSFNAKPIPQPMWFPPPDQPGNLYAKVIEAIESTHCGDFFRGLFPVTPKVGDILLLGTGTASVETINGIKTFLLTPIQLRDNDWLNPRALYNCHESIVELIWQPV